WELPTRMVVDELAVGRLIEHHDSEPLADVLSGLPAERDWTSPHPWLIRAALLLPTGSDDEVSAALAAAEGKLQSWRPEDEVPARVAAATSRLALSRRSGNLESAKAAAAMAVAQVERMSADQLAAHPEVKPQVMTSVGLVQFWSGRFDHAAGTLAAAAASAGRAEERVGCLGNLALVEALRGRLQRAATLAVETRPAPPPLPAPPPHPRP